LVLAGVRDLLDPERETLEAASYVHGAQFESIDPRWPSGHFSAVGTTQPEVDFQNHEIAAFLTRIAANKHIEGTWALAGTISRNWIDCM
jgi:homoserine O-acetyltransferase